MRRIAVYVTQTSLPVCPGSCIRLAGGSPVAVMTKQRCSGWPAQGEILCVEASRQRPLWGRASRRSVTLCESCSVVIRPAVWQKEEGAEPLDNGRRPSLGVKNLELQPRETLRRRGIGTFAQPSTEQERSVSTPAVWPQVANLGCPGMMKPITGNTGKWWSVERKSEEAVVATIGVDNRTRRSEGPLARCAIKQRPRLIAAEEPRRSLGPIANAVACGMLSVDCLGESRVRENFMHGLGRGERRRTEDAQPSRSLGDMSVARLSPTSPPI